MRRPEKTYHPRSGELYTPITPELAQLLERMRQEYGTWRDVAAVSGLKLRVLRRIKSPYGGRKTISMTLLDRIISSTGVGTLEEFLWFTPEDLEALGIWDNRIPLGDEQGAIDNRTQPSPTD